MKKIFRRNDRKCADIVKQMKDSGLSYNQITKKLNQEGWILASGKELTKTDPNKALIDFYPEYRAYSSHIKRARTNSHQQKKTKTENHLVAILSSDMDRETKKYLLNKLL